MSDGGEGSSSRAHGPVELHGFEILGPCGDTVFATATVGEACGGLSPQRPSASTHVSGNGMDASLLGWASCCVKAAHTAPGPVMLGLGGTGTMDGGLGMLQALGFTFVTARVAASTPPPRPETSRLARIEGTPQIPGTLIRHFVTSRPCW